MNTHNLGSRTVIKHFDKNGKKTYEREIKKDKIIDKNELGIIVRDKDGNVIDEWKQPMKSYLYNFLKMLWRNESYTADYVSNPVDYLGTERTSVLYYNMALGGDGIRVSTDADAIDINTYGMSGLIGIGSGAGQLVHSGHLTSAPAKDDGTNYNIKYQRTFSNNSGNTISIRSAGIFKNTGGYNFFMVKDLLDKNGAAININLANGQSVTFTYNFWWDLADGWTRGMINNIYNCLANIYAPTGSPGGLFTLDIDGQSVWGNEYENNVSDAVRIISAVSATYGIRVGTGSSVITQDNYAPEGLIGIGTGAGQLSHDATNMIWIGAVGNTASYRYDRTFTNNSAGQIIINNYGVVRRNYTAYNAFEDRRIMNINKLTGNIVLDPGEAVTIIHYVELNVT